MKSGTDEVDGSEHIRWWLVISLSGIGLVLVVLGVFVNPMRSDGFATYAAGVLASIGATLFLAGWLVLCERRVVRFVRDEARAVAGKVVADTSAATTEAVEQAVEQSFSRVDSRIRDLGRRVQLDNATAFERLVHQVPGVRSVEEISRYRIIAHVIPSLLSNEARRTIQEFGSLFNVEVEFRDAGAADTVDFTGDAEKD